jgi:hypothetical protein
LGPEAASRKIRGDRAAAIDPKATLASGSFVEGRFAIGHDRIFGLRTTAIGIVLD